jgi:hypothetical protein
MGCRCTRASASLVEPSWNQITGLNPYNEIVLSRIPCEASITSGRGVKIEVLWRGAELLPRHKAPAANSANASRAPTISSTAVIMVCRRATPFALLATQSAPPQSQLLGSTRLPGPLHSTSCRSCPDSQVATQRRQKINPQHSASLPHEITGECNSR